MWREPQDAVLDMLQACEEVLLFASGADLRKLQGDLLRLRALERSLSILGEAAKRAPHADRSRWPAVPWREAAGLRDVLVHDYFGVDIEVVARVITEDIPYMRDALQASVTAEGWSP